MNTAIKITAIVTLALSAITIHGCAQSAATDRVMVKAGLVMKQVPATQTWI